MTSDVVRFFKETLDIVGKDKAFMLMKTNPKDQEGADLIEVCKMLGLNPEQIAFFEHPVPH
jgi:predicted secreted protein